jgi:hypothetical protein
MNKEERQIKEAFIDGYLSDYRDNGGRVDEAMAERAWREENETHPEEPVVPVNREHCASS